MLMTVMEELTKSEYFVLTLFYEQNCPMTKKELIERYPECNANTVASVLDRLVEKNYLEIVTFWLTFSSLARSYRPTRSVCKFYESKFSEEAVNCLVMKSIKSLDSSQLTLLSDRIRQKKFLLNNNIIHYLE